MAPFGKLYGFKGNARTNALLIVAKANDLDIELVETKPGATSTDYQKLNRLGKIPTFEGADNYIVSEVIAIAVYLTSQNEKTTLLGKTKQDYASILRWLSFANSELLPKLAGAFRPINGLEPYNKKSVQDSLDASAKNATVLEDHLTVNTYLVGERLTLADLFVASIATRGFEFFWDKEWRAAHPAVTRWFDTVRNQSVFSSVWDDVKIVETAIANQPPKKEKEEKPKAAAAAPAKKQEKKKADDEEEDDRPAEPKAKHPLESLPKATFVLDDWKRKYSNEDTRSVALPWFWENVKFDEYSVWRVDYKYNDELTQTFMTSNLIGGFFNRLEASRKYLFGAASVFGVSNDSVLRGAFVLRGQEALPVFDVAPDYESYEITKLDHTKAEDKEFIGDMWSWDKPIEVNGKTYEWADGKVFK